MVLAFATELDDAESPPDPPPPQAERIATVEAHKMNFPNPGLRLFFNLSSWRMALRKSFVIYLDEKHPCWTTAELRKSLVSTSRMASALIECAVNDGNLITFWLDSMRDKRRHSIERKRFLLRLYAGSPRVIAHAT
jgi:hypothetical protein